MSKDRKLDDAELANISGAGGGNVDVNATDEIPDPGPTPAVKPPASGGGGGGGHPDGLESDNETGGNQELNRD